MSLFRLPPPIETIIPRVPRIDLLWVVRWVYTFLVWSSCTSGFATAGTGNARARKRVGFCPETESPANELDGKAGRGEHFYALVFLEYACTFGERIGLFG